MAVPVLDTTRSPIWTVRIPETVSVDEYRAYLSTVLEACKDGERYALLLDFADFKPISGDSQTRLGIAKAVNEHVKDFERYIVCEARIVANPMMRAITTLFDWISPFPWPTRNVASIQVAQAWVRSRMAMAGIPLSDDAFDKDLPNR